MKPIIVFAVSALVILHTANSYILLTANLEDVQSLAKQLAASPVVDQIHRIWRRASSQFKHHMAKSKIQKRANEDQDDEGKEVNRNEDLPEPEKSSYQSNEKSSYIARRNTQDHDDIVALGKNASIYLKSIKQIFEKV